MKLLSPVFIGSGDILFPATYRREEDKAYIYRENDLFEKSHSPETLFNIKTETVRIEQIVSLDTIKSLTPIHTMHIWETDIDLENQETDTFINEAETRYIPGSSVKGAMLHAVRRHNREWEKPFSESFAIADLGFESQYSTLQRGFRVSATKMSTKQNQDNVKEWFVSGKTEPIQSHFRKANRVNQSILLEAIRDHTDDWLWYQHTYFQFLLEHYDELSLPVKEHEIAHLLKLIEWYRGENAEADQPLLILGSNTHKFSKTLDLTDKPTYHFTKDSDDHPLTRLLIRDDDGQLTLPGLVKLVKS